MSGSGSACLLQAYDIPRPDPERAQPGTSSSRSPPCASRRGSSQQSVAVGYDIRLSSPDFRRRRPLRPDRHGGGRRRHRPLRYRAGLLRATSHLNLDGGVMVTASHNPAELQRAQAGEGARQADQRRTPASWRSRRSPRGQASCQSSKKGTVKHVDLQDAYVSISLLRRRPSLRPLKIVSNAGNRRRGGRRRSFGASLAVYVREGSPRARRSVSRTASRTRS